MGKYNFSKYFDKKGQKYYDPKIMITILSDILGKNIDELKRDLANFKVTVTREQIIQYLERKFEEENPDVKERIESKNYQNLSNNLTDWTDEDMALFLQKSEDRGIASKYAFSPHLFNYFNKYSNIVRKKAEKILNIIEKIANQDSSTIIELLDELDIELDENGNILKTDIVRLILPFVYNYKRLIEKINEANNLETYLIFKQSRYTLARSGISEEELYPTERIHVLEQNFYYRKDCINLSPKQKKLMRERRIENIQAFSDIFFKSF